MEELMDDLEGELVKSITVQEFYLNSFKNIFKG